MAQCLDNNSKFAWDIVVGYGRPMKFGVPKHEEMSVNSKGHFTTVDGVPVRKLFVANLTSYTLQKDLILLFSRFGKVVEASVVKPQNLSKPHFGFVTYETPAEATSALRNKNRLFIFQRKLYVSPADSWHQPLELPDGQILWNRRKGAEKLNKDEEQEDGDAEEGETSSELQDPELSVDDDTCAISKLNDDCLLLIFNCIPLNERLSLHKVCRRWKALSLGMWFGLRKLDFTTKPLSNDQLTDTLLKTYISLCPNITSINLAIDGHKLTTNAIVTIAERCRNLEDITMRDMQMKKRSLALLARCCPNLKAFHMDTCSSRHDSEMVALVKKCHNLEHISMKFSSSPCGLWLKYLQCPLKSLTLEMYDLNPDNLIEGIKNVKDTIKELRFVSCDAIRSRDVETIASNIPELTSLTLAGGFSDFKSHSLNPITKLTKLTHLDLDNNSYVCDHFLNELSEHCTLLQNFSLSGIDDRYLTTQGLSALSKFTGLTQLTLACVRKLNDSILKSLSQKLKQLKHLDLMGCVSITDEGCQSIVTHCKELEILDVSGCGNVTNLTVIAAIESTKGSQRRLKIIAGESGIDLDVCWPRSVIVDPSSSIMSHYPGAMFILDPDFEIDNEVFFNNLFLDDYEDDDMYEDFADDDSIYGDDNYGYIHFRCHDTDSSDGGGNFDDYSVYFD